MGTGYSVHDGHRGGILYRITRKQAFNLSIIVLMHHVSEKCLSTLSPKLTRHPTMTV